ncbi:MAG: 4Fe-4S dicluster domain-containing protein [Gemmataceae bacterium]|nr:4Fe-4S dicluster domain-containing protein [Gemmataceae bacterium]
MTEPRAANPLFLPKSRLDDLIGQLAAAGFEVVGPRLEQQAIVYGPIRSASDLPIGWTDLQGPGSYRLQRRGDEAYFGYVVGPHSWKKYLFPPTLTLWHARRTGDTFTIEESNDEPPRRALLGVRGCELHAIAVQDRVFLNRAGQFTDPFYAKARQRLFLIAVECETAGGTCFCTSMGTGPQIDDPLDAHSAPRRGRHAYDLALTELDDGFVVRVGSAAGQDLVARLGLAAAAPEQIAEGRRRVAAAAQAMGRWLDTTDLRQLLHRNQEHPRWDAVADRCLSCTNCTMVCPTCFCSSVADVTDLSLENAQRVRKWDSCFNPEFAKVHGGDFRPSIRARYRQWLTHKFASWYDQFDVSGCVGCGRCITWCPVGIDVTEEINAIRAADGQRRLD